MADDRGTTKTYVASGTPSVCTEPWNMYAAVPMSDSPTALQMISIMLFVR